MTTPTQSLGTSFIPATDSAESTGQLNGRLIEPIQIPDSTDKKTQIVYRGNPYAVLYGARVWGWATIIVTYVGFLTTVSLLIAGGVLKSQHPEDQMALKLLIAGGSFGGICLFYCIASTRLSNEKCLEKIGICCV